MAQLTVVLIVVEAYMTVNGQLVARSPADDLRSRLDEPQVAASLNTLLDHVDLLAVVAVAFDGFFSRADVIADTLAEAVGDLRGASGANPLAGVDIKGLVTSLSSLIGPVTAATPALAALMAQLAEPRTVELVSKIGRAMDEARRMAETDPSPPTGVFALLRALKDPDVARALGFLTFVAKAFGRELKSH